MFLKIPTYDNDAYMGWYFQYLILIDVCLTSVLASIFELKMSGSKGEMQVQMRLIPSG